MSNPHGQREHTEETECCCCHKHAHEHNHGGCSCHGQHEHHEHHEGCGCHEHHEHHEGCGRHEHHEHHDSCGCHKDGHKHHGCGCHDHGDDGCGCGHDHSHTANAGELRALGIRLGAGAALLAAALLAAGLPGWCTVILYGAAYLIIGWPILRETVEHLPRGNIFDENLLMTVASIGAFILGDRLEAVAVVTLYQLGELLQGLAVAKSKKSIAQIMDIRPDHANLLENTGAVQTVAPETVPVGSLILIRPGERVPLDCTVVDGTSALDTAALTGESLPQEAAAGDELLSGCINLNGVLTARTTQSFELSTVQRILKLTQESAAHKSTAEKFITRFARVYTPAVFALAALLAVLPPVLGLGSWGDWLYRGLVFLVVSCPCALVISVPVSFLAGMGGAARRGVLLKGGDVLDRLCGARSVVFDKTGTLTGGRFTVRAVLPAEGTGEEQLLYAAAVCEAHSTHPIARSVLEYCTGRIGLPEPDSCTEHPGEGIRAEAGGKEYLAGNLRLMENAGVSLPELPAPQTAGGTVLYIACDGRYLGALHIADTVKPEAQQALQQLRRAGVHRLILLSGDRRAAVEQLAAELALDDWRAELLPQDKVAAFEELCSGEGPHLYVGDGINDAPLLARADVGIAMGGIGSDAAVEAADCVLMKDDLSGVALALRCARRTRGIVRQNIIFALGAKCAVLIAAALGYAPMWLAIFADVGVALLCVINATRALAVR